MGKVMDKKPLIGVSIIAVILLILGSSTNVVGNQTVQSLNQNVINNKVSHKSYMYHVLFTYLFGTISNLTVSGWVYHFYCVNLRVLTVWNDHHGNRGYSYEHFVNHEFKSYWIYRFLGTMKPTFLWGYFYDS
jgi:hypothetical protein